MERGGNVGRGIRFPFWRLVSWSTRGVCLGVEFDGVEGIESEVLFPEKS
jgi:hypothetical protein